jgi:hypothetical protein
VPEVTTLPHAGLAEPAVAEPLRGRVRNLMARLDPRHQRALQVHARAARLGEKAVVSADAAAELAQAHEALAAAIRDAGLTAADFLEGTGAEALRLALPLFDRVLAEDPPPVSKPTSEVAPDGRRKLLVWAGVATAIAFVVTAGLLATSQHPSSSALEPALLTAPPIPPSSGEPSRPLPEWPTKLEVSTSIEAGQLVINAARLSTDAYVAVALIDARGQKWLARPGDQRDPSCANDCGPLELHVALDHLAPGAFRLMVMVSGEPITRLGIWQWLPQADQVAPRWLFVRAYAVRRIER